MKIRGLVSCAVLAGLTALGCNESHITVADAAMPPADSGLIACASGETNCAGHCVVVSEDDRNCGTCGHVCPSGQRCGGATCMASCGAPLIACAASCVDPRNDPRNCGACAVACDPMAYCAAGVCTPTGSTSCDAPRTLCDGSCVDPSSDPRHCGACDVACAVGETCSLGVCSSSTCSGTRMDCGAGCVDTQTDPENCGACSAACASDERCASGVCVSGCGAMASCPSGCADLATDSANCGACGHACSASETCVTSACACATGSARCGTACTDLAHDSMHCGACGTVCGRGTYCADGTCAVASSDWPTLGGSGSRSGLNAGETHHPPGTRAWGTAASADALRPVAIAEGRAFVTSASRFAVSDELVAYDLANGVRLWGYDFGDSDSVGQPTWSNGVVYVGVNKGIHDATTNMWAFDASTGRVLWRTPFGSQWETFWAPLVVNDRVYANGGQYGGLYGWSTTSGTQTFFVSGLEQYDQWSPAWDGTSVLSFIAGHLRSHDPASGMITRTTTVPWDWRGWSMHTSPVVDGTRTFLVAPPSLVAVETASGAVLWSISHAFEGMPAAANGHVYAISSGALEARAAADGALEWTFAGDSHLASSAILTPSHVYVSSDDHVYALDRSTGNMVWSTGGGGALSVGEGYLVVAGTTGTLTVFALAP